METIMAWVSKCSFKDIQTGNHKKPDNCILIQIVDYDRDFPEPKFKSSFKEIHYFSFMDFDQGDGDLTDFGISNVDAKAIAEIILNAHHTETNILVHCMMGVSRSGGVLEACEYFGFETEPLSLRCPNLMVKQKIITFAKEIINNDKKYRS